MSIQSELFNLFIKIQENVKDSINYSDIDIISHSDLMSIALELAEKYEGE